jgi:hypothetical protein
VVAETAMIIQLKFISVRMYRRGVLAMQVLITKTAQRNNTQNTTNTQKQNTKRPKQKEKDRKKAI